MNYHSTRNEQLTASSTHAVLQGIAPDGGPYICDPAALRFALRAALATHTPALTAALLPALLPEIPYLVRLVRHSYDAPYPPTDLTTTGATSVSAVSSAMSAALQTRMGDTLHTENLRVY